MMQTFYFYIISLLLLCYLLILSMPQVFEQSLFLFLSYEGTKDTVDPAWPLGCVCLSVGTWYINMRVRRGPAAMNYSEISECAGLQVLDGNNCF